jgi:hypothetical protein
MMTLLMAMALQAAVAVVPHPDRAMFSEIVEAGRMVGETDAVGLCAGDDDSAQADMEALAVGMLLPKSRMLPLCTSRIQGTWRVVRVVADRCLAPPGQQWCEVEAHAVVVQNGRDRRYAIIMVTADQLD